jgi:hypothetical protein
MTQTANNIGRMAVVQVNGFKYVGNCLDLGPDGVRPKRVRIQQGYEFRAPNRQGEVVMCLPGSLQTATSAFVMWADEEED